MKEAQEYRHKSADSYSIAYLAPNISNLDELRKPSNIIDARNRFPKRVEDEKILQVPLLARKIQKIKQLGDEELYYLKKTGFQTETQVRLLLKNLSEGLPLEVSLQQIEQDIQAFKTEYLIEGPLFPILLDKIQQNGKARVAGRMYGGKLWVDATDGIEREGAVKRSVQEMEDFLIGAKPGSLALMTSPDGWSGYDGIKYPDTQTYAVEVQKNGDLRGFTIKTDMTLSQNQELLNHYGALQEEPLDQLSEKERIKRIVGSVVKFDPKDNKSIESIVKDIKQIMGSEVAYKDTIGKNRLFSETLHLLKNPESLWTLDTITQELVNQLKEYISHRIQSFDLNVAQDIRIALGYTILQLMHKIRPSKKGSEMLIGTTYIPKEADFLPFDPRKQIKELEKIGGCAGGGSSSGEVNVIVNSATPRLGEYGELLRSSEGCDCINNSDNHYHCPECNKKYADETQKKPEERTKKCGCGFKFGC